MYRRIKKSVLIISVFNCNYVLNLKDYYLKKILFKRRCVSISEFLSTWKIIIRYLKILENISAIAQEKQNY